MLKFRFRLRTLLLVVTLSSVYFAAYFALLAPIEYNIVAGDAYPPIVTLATIREINYVHGGSVSRVLFSPLNWLVLRQV